MATAPKTHRPHTGSTPRQLYDKRRGSAQERGYNHQWHKVRASKVKDNPLCEDCEDAGLTVPVDEVDHVIPITGHGDPLRLDMHNLRSRCKACHTKKTRLDQWIRRMYDDLVGDGIDCDEARDTIIEKVKDERAEWGEKP